ncbi:MAG: hypothetical protein SWJ54_23145, partial [Cyanobacteriota bacterium]|nr:hypothetical protein [Cyanobacteriota bacterium]
SIFVQGDNNTVEIHVIQCSTEKELEPEILKEKTEIEFWISGKLKNKKHKTTLKALEKHLQKISSDFLLTIDDVEEGSLKFILKGSPEGLEQLERLFNAGELTEVFGVPVENVSFVESDRKKLALTIAGDISQTDLAKLKATITGVDEMESHRNISRRNIGDDEKANKKTMSKNSISPLIDNIIKVSKLFSSLFSRKRC